MFPQLYLIESKSVPLFKIIQSKQGDQTISLEYVEILAYSGGQVDLGLQYPIIFDLRSTKSAPSVPLLADHNPLTIVGHTETVTISPTNITVAGPLSGTGEKANEIKNNFKNKFPYQASVGIVSEGLRFIPEGKSEVINGQSAIGPVYIAENNLLREVSILSLGADPNTLAKLVASFYKGMKMPTFEEWVKSLQFDPANLTPEQLAALQTVYDELSTAKTNGNLTNDQQVSANARAKALVQALMSRLMSHLLYRMATIICRIRRIFLRRFGVHTLLSKKGLIRSKFYKLSITILRITKERVSSFWQSRMDGVLIRHI
jgi:hypothetical protein